MLDDLPVPGWDAEPTPEIMGRDGYPSKLASFKIVSCPEFLQDEVKI